MPVVISDETHRDAGLTEREALVEIACRLIDRLEQDLGFFISASPRAQILKSAGEH
jgi:hypothetical protein